ncbi:hypothetical protein V8D89_001951, partial [Ganoderma adspersum]
EERFDVLDIEKHESFREQLELKSLWNRSVAANQLPNEIFFHIFVYFNELPRNSNGGDGEGGDAGSSVNVDIPEFRRKSHRWMKLMLVCRHWRDVAVATPALWRTIDVKKTSFNWMELALTRSGDATIDVSFPSDVNKEHASLLQPHCHRLRSLRVRSWSLCALPLISSTLPALETLETYRNLDGDRNRPSNLGITRARFPSLRCLRLVWTVIPQDASFYTPLRRLALVRCPFKASLEEFVELLAGCPDLEYLELNDFLQQLSGGENVGPPLSLPSLVSVGVFCHAPIHSARFLSRIIVPSRSVELAVVASLYNEEHPEGTVRASVPQNLAGTVPSLATLTWARITVSFEQWFIEGHPTLPGPDETPLAVFSLTTSWLTFEWRHQMSEGLADLLAVFGAAPLTHLEVVGSCATVTAETWTTVFRTFPCLVSLEAAAEGALFVGLQAAESPASLTPDNAESDSPTIACRGLERISVFHYSNLLHTPESVLEPAIDCLRYRAEKGTRLKELRMMLNMQMDSAQRYLPHLKDLVSEVELKCTS